MTESKKKLDTGLNTPEPKEPKLDKIDMLMEAIAKLNEAVVMLGSKVKEMDSKMDEYKDLFRRTAKAGRM